MVTVEKTNSINRFDIEVYNALRELGIPAHVKGYEFIKSAAKYLRNNPDSIYKITKELYPGIAEVHGTTPSRIERGIRHAICLSTANDAVWYKVLGVTCRPKVRHCRQDG